MTARIPAQTERCYRCGQIHVEDIRHGWRAPNPDGKGTHAWTPPPHTTPAATNRWGGRSDTRPNRPGWRSSFFGALLSCERCGTMRDAAHRDLVARHERLCHGGGGDAA